MNEINLENLTPKQLPTEKIKANLDGTEKEYTVRALNDLEVQNIKSLISGSVGMDDPTSASKIYIALLSAGIGVTPAVATAIFASKYGKDAITVADKVWELSDIFDKAKVKELESAEKN